MKTMTCKQLGGPCDFPHHGETADEVIKAQDKHLKDVVATGDATHEGLEAARAYEKHQPPDALRRYFFSQNPGTCGRSTCLRGRTYLSCSSTRNRVAKSEATEV